MNCEPKYPEMDSEEYGDDEVVGLVNRWLPVPFVPVCCIPSSTTSHPFAMNYCPLSVRHLFVIFNFPVLLLIQKTKTKFEISKHSKYRFDRISLLGGPHSLSLDNIWTNFRHFPSIPLKNGRVLLMLQLGPFQLLQQVFSNWFGVTDGADVLFN